MLTSHIGDSKHPAKKRVKQLSVFAVFAVIAISAYDIFTFIIIHFHAYRQQMTRLRLMRIIESVK